MKINDYYKVESEKKCSISVRTTNKDSKITTPVLASYVEEPFAKGGIDTVRGILEIAGHISNMA